MFRSLFTSSIVIMMIAISPPQASAAEAPQPTQRELELERQVQALKAQLEDANKTIADLQDQVNDGASAPASSAAIADSSAAPTPAGSDQSVATAPPISVAEPTSTTPTFASGLNLGEDPSDMSERQAEVARTPAAITSLGPAELLLGGVEDASRLEYLVPSLRYGQTGQDVRLSMRGARTNSIGPESDPVVAVYEDGIYLATTTEGV